MPIYNGSTKIGTNYHGGTLIKRIYKGGTVVYRRAVLRTFAQTFTTNSSISIPATATNIQCWLVGGGGGGAVLAGGAGATGTNTNGSVYGSGGQGYSGTNGSSGCCRITYSYIEYL